MRKSISFEKNLQSDRFEGISGIILWLRFHLEVYCPSIGTTTIKILKETPGGGTTFTSPAVHEQSWRRVAVDTFNCEAIQPFGGGAAGLGMFRESN